ncbi:Uncharacterised protein [uncultured archaeon]|nr:Uncharacterised protein [uncultured archaeon]
MRLKRRFLFLALTALGLAILTPGCFAQPAEMGETGDMARNELGQNNAPNVQPSGNMDGAPAGIIFHHWQGFALKGDQSYILRVSIESIRPVGPMNVRKLLASNKTLEEVGKEILAEEGNVTYRGHLRLGESTYWLTNVEVRLARSNFTLSADLNEPLENPAASNSTETVGRITVNTTGYEGERKSQGKLIIATGQLIGSYRVLLDMLH